MRILSNVMKAGGAFNRKIQVFAIELHEFIIELKSYSMNCFFYFGPKSKLSGLKIYFALSKVIFCIELIEITRTSVNYFFSPEIKILPHVPT